jgi:hypothetical protein
MDEASLLILQKEIADLEQLLANVKQVKEIIRRKKAE